MATRASGTRARTVDSSPNEGSVATPNHAFQDRTGNSDLVLNSIVGLERAVSALSTKVDALIDAQKTASSRLEKAEDKLSGVTHKIYAAGVVLFILVAVGGWVVNASWTLISAIATPAIKEAVTQHTAQQHQDASQPSPSRQ